MNPTTAQDINIVAGKHTHVTLTPQWFLQGAEYPSCLGAYAPLVNGEAAFGAVAQAIKSAKKSIDIITWGFQASMYFERPGGKMVGELLEEAGKRGVKVRVLVWFADTAQIIGGPNFPGWGASVYESANKTGRPESNKDAFKRYAKRLPELKKNLAASGEKLDYESLEQYAFDKYWHFRASVNDIENVTVRHREMSWFDSRLVETRLKELTPYTVSDDSSITHGAALFWGATHHQKMVLVDYEDPELAVGFVMGHNMLSQYWDRDSHTWRRDFAMSGRDAYTAWQDISGCVYGEILCHMNDNFVQSWEKDTGDGELKAKRASIRKQVFSPKASRLTEISKRLSLPVALKSAATQILRTQPQYKAYDIFKTYMESVRRSLQYIYIENQYFRFHELAEEIKGSARLLLNHGRTEPLYMFVVTNSTTDPDIISGGMQTWNMMEALGRADVLPVYTAKKKGINVQDVHPRDIPGLKVHICTLVSPDSEGGNWQRTYVHSKLMMIDDTFLIQGSANINLRSMAFDSEIAIALHDTDQAPIVKPMREKIWELHTKLASKSPAKGPVKKEESVFSDYFDGWTKIIEGNKDRQKGTKRQRPIAALIEFFDGSPTLKNKD